MENIDFLKYAIEDYTDNRPNKMRSGMKSGIFYLIKNSAEKYIGYYLKINRDDFSTAVTNFLYIFGLMKEKIFADAVNDLNKHRNAKQKKPSKMPVEEDIQTIPSHVITTMEKFTNEYEILDAHSFVHLRDCACVRFNTFNGKLGGEPARLTTKEWEEAWNDV